MTRKAFVVACCLIVCGVSSMAGQSRTEPPDPITGTWTGDLVTGERSDAIPVTFQLTFDGKAAVSGSFTGLPNPGDVKKGTFDAKTGAVKLQLGKTGSDAVLLTLEGTVAKGVFTGKFSGEVDGEFTLTKKR